MQRHAQLRDKAMNRLKKVEKSLATVRLTMLLFKNATEHLLVQFNPSN